MEDQNIVAIFGGLGGFIGGFLGSKIFLNQRTVIAGLRAGLFALIGTFIVKRQD